MSKSNTSELRWMDREAVNRRIEEALYSIREKDPRSATIERLRIVRDADALVTGLPQPLQLGEGLYYLLDRIALPVSPDDLIVGRILEEIPDSHGEKLLAEAVDQWGRGIPSWMQDGGHECFDWERLIELGLTGLLGVAQSELRKRAATGEKEETLDFLRGAIRIYEAFINYAQRYALAAQEAGLENAAACCVRLSQRRPETFIEAVQLMWLVGTVYCTMASVNPTLTFGRMDELLLAFYIRDLEEDTLTRDQAGAIIEDFYCKNNLVLGRGEHQMSGGTEKDTGWIRNLTYDAPQYVVLGGYRRDGSTNDHALTELMVERIVPSFENPVIVFRYTRDVPDPLWSSLCQKMQSNASVLVYSDESIVPAMIHSGFEREDAVSYTMHGCNWPDIPGKERSLGGCHIDLPQHLLQAIMDSDHPLSMDAVYDRFMASINSVVNTSFDDFRTRRREWDSLAPGILRVDDCFLEGPVVRARSWTLGGTPYSTLLGSLRSIGTAADCMAALDMLVFSSKKVSIEDLRVALADDYEGHEVLRRQCLNAPKFGQDNTLADEHAVRILNTITEVFDRASHKGSPDEVIATRCLETDMAHIGAGAELGATPDGRRAGQPVSENTSPYPGSCTGGITAMLKSLSELPFHRFNSGALNVRLQRRMVDGTDGLARLAALLRAYFNMGGMQIQVSVADTEELRNAQTDPESHRDLMVRITGYSAVFVDMCENAQNEFIRRQELSV